MRLAENAANARLYSRGHPFHRFSNCILDHLLQVMLPKQRTV
jgi:hypothetical protein